VGWSSLHETCEDLRDYEAGGQDREVNEEANASNDVVGSFESKEERLAERECLECGTTWPLLGKAGLSTGSFADRFRPGSVYLSLTAISRETHQGPSSVVRMD